MYNLYILLSFLGYLVYFVSLTLIPKKLSRVLASIGIATGLLFHIAQFSFLFSKSGVGYLNSPSRTLNLTVFLLALSSGLIYLLKKQKLVIWFFGPIILGSYIICHLLPDKPATISNLDLGFWLGPHIAFAILGNFLFLLSFLCSLLYLWLDFRLKSKKNLRILKEFPSMNHLERYNLRSMILGLGLMLLAIFSGLKGFEFDLNPALIWDPRMITTYFICLFYSTLVASGVFKTIRGRQFASFSILIFGLLIVCFVGLSVLGIGAHSRSPL